MDLFIQEKSIQYVVPIGFCNVTKIMWMKFL